MRITSLVVIRLLILFLRTDAELVGLYDNEKDDVVVLNEGNFYRTVLGSSTAWLVEFYNTWCGHCKRFAPDYKQVATNTKAWKKVIEVGAIDCSRTENVEICNAYNVEGYPTLRFFEPYCTKNNTGMEYFEQEPDLIIREMSSFVGNITKHGPNWPNLQSLNSLDHIWKEHSPLHKFVALIFEEEDSLLGRQVILDMCGYKNILVRRALKPLMKKFGIKKYPSLFLLHTDGMYQQLAKGEKTRERFVIALKKTMGINVTEELARVNNSLKKSEDSHSRNDFVSKNQETEQQVFMQDLESTLTYLMRQEVAVHRTVSNDALSALKKFIGILAKFFPGREEVRSYLRKVNKWLSDYTGELSGLHWLHTIEGIQSVDTFLPEKVKWIGCKGSQPKFRGYPCGMWTLFHTLTVSAHNREKSSSSIVHFEVLEAIIGYMRHFFGCQDCSNHFIKMTKNINDEVISPGDEVLWLWKAHNSANKRLHGDETEDPYAPKVQFPLKKTCSKCHTKSSTNENPVWDLDEVLKFLSLLYDKESIIEIPEEDEDSNKDLDYLSKEKNKEQMDWWERKQRKKDIEKIRLLHQAKQKSKDVFRNAVRRHIKKRRDSIPEKAQIFANREQQPHHYGNVGLSFSRIDVGMCVVFYITCTMIVLLLYYHFSVRRLRHPCRLLPL